MDGDLSKLTFADLVSLRNWVEARQEDELECFNLSTHYEDKKSSEEMAVHLEHALDGVNNECWVRFRELFGEPPKLEGIRLEIFNKEFKEQQQNNQNGEN